MSKKFVSILLISIFLLSFISGFGLYYFTSRMKFKNLNERLTSTSNQLNNLKKQISKLESEIAEIRRTNVDKSTQTSTTTENISMNDKTETETTVLTGRTLTREFCFIKEVKKRSGKYYLLADYAQFLTEEEAEAAAREYGESLEGDGYYILNENPRIRTLQIDTSKLKIYMYLKPEGYTGEKYLISFEKWFRWFNGLSGGTEQVKFVPYWITLEDGKVVKVEQQFLP